MQNIKETKKAFSILEEEGAKSYLPERVNHISSWEKVGMALARISDFSKNILQLAYTFLEDWNFHSICSVINWIGGLYPLSLRDLLNIKNEIDGVYNLKQYDIEGNHILIKMRVTVAYEELKD
jgi:hypothetical protein